MAKQSSRILKKKPAPKSVDRNEPSDDASSVVLMLDLAPKISRNLSEATRARVVELREAGKTYRDICASVKLPHGTVSGIIRRLKDKGRQFAINPKFKPIVHLSLQIKAKIVEMHSQGALHEIIANSLKISRLSIKNIVDKLNAFGITAALSNTKKPRTSQERESVIKMFNDGSSPREISVELDIPKSTVRSILQRFKSLGIAAAINNTPTRQVHSFEDKQKIIQLHNENHLAETIAADLKYIMSHFRIPFTSVSSIIRQYIRHGEASLKKLLLTNEQKKNVFALSSIMNHAEIATALDIPQNYIYNALKKGARKQLQTAIENIEIELTSEERECVFALHETMTELEIADTMTIPVATVRYILEKQDTEIEATDDFIEVLHEYGISSDEIAVMLGLSIDEVCGKLN